MASHPSTDGVHVLAVSLLFFIGKIHTLICHMRLGITNFVHVFYGFTFNLLLKDFYTKTLIFIYIWITHAVHI